MDNTSVHDEGFDIDSYLEKWNEENAGDNTDEAEEPTQTEEAENENAAAGTAEEVPVEEDTDDASDEDAENDAHDSDATAESEDEQAQGSDDDTHEDSEEAESAPADEENAAAENGTVNFRERFSAALAEIQTEFPDVQTASDIGDIRTFAILTTVGGLSALDAYKTIKNTAPATATHATSDEIAAAEARGAQRAAGKSHLRSTVPKGAGENEGGLTDSEAERLSEDLGIPIKDVRRLYKRVTK